MGLDFSHCDAHWTYGGFNQFRHRLASKAMGFEVDNIYDHRNIVSYFRIDPIYKFLDHSDCDGILTPEEMKTIYPRLDELVDAMHLDCTDDNYDIMYDIINGKKLVEGMREAVSKNENLEFR